MPKGKCNLEMNDAKYIHYVAVLRNGIGFYQFYDPEIMLELGI